MKTSLISSVLIKVRGHAQAEGMEGKAGGEETSSQSSETLRSVPLKLFSFFLLPCFLVIPCQINGGVRLTRLIPDAALQRSSRSLKE